MCESAPSFHHRGIILWCNLYNVSDNGGNIYVGEYSGFLHFHASAIYARRRLLCFHCFPLSVPSRCLSRCPDIPPFAPGLHSKTSRTRAVTAQGRVQDHSLTWPGSDVKLIPPTGCFGWCRYFVIFYSFGTQCRF